MPAPDAQASLAGRSRWAWRIAGQRLVQLESAELRASERQAQANLANAQAQLERNARLHEKGFVGKAVLDDAERNFEVARTQLDAARARLAYTVIRSPARGTLIARNVERGDSKSAQGVFDLMRQVNRERGTTVLVVTHNHDLARQCDRIVEIVDGRITSERRTH